MSSRAEQASASHAPVRVRAHAALACALLACVALVLGGGGVARAADAHTLYGKLRGIVHVRTGAGAASHQSVSPPPGLGGGQCPPASANNLCFHGGSVMHSNRSFAIFWAPSGFGFSDGYIPAVDGFLANVAADSGKLSNVYASDPQYTDAGGSAAYASTFGGGFLDTRAYPASGCSDLALNVLPITAPCLTDGQLQQEVDHAVAVNGWPRGPGSVFFVLLPQNVGSCQDASSTQCAYTPNGYCAYHANNPPGPLQANTALYGVIMYSAVQGCDYPNPSIRPSGTDADPAISALSHEHNESVTDPAGDGWFDTNGNEDGDKCADSYGAALGSTDGGPFNQAIGGGFYYLQDEWSNAASGCISRITTPPPVAAFAAAPNPAAPGRPVTFDGTRSKATAGASIVTYSWNFGDGSPPAGGAAVTHTYGAPGTYSASLLVVDSHGASNSGVVSITVTRGAARTRKRSHAALARALRLPRQGATLSVNVRPGQPRVRIGRASCPPACSIAVRAYFFDAHHHRVVVAIARFTLAPGHGRALVLKLTSAGRKLLRGRRRLSVALALTVGDEQAQATRLSLGIVLRAK